MNSIPFSPYEIPTERRIVIEASAGTGKTYNIASIFLHFLLKGIPVAKILVVTFTEAATKELRDRLRQRVSDLSHQIHQILLAPETWTATGDLRLILSSNEKPLTEIPSRNLLLAAVQRLNQAQVDFESASILTIHGFCSRLQTRHALECGLSFDRELIDDDARLLDFILHDYIRTWWYWPNFPEIERIISQNLDYISQFISTFLESPSILEDYGSLENQSKIYKNSSICLEKLTKLGAEIPFLKSTKDFVFSFKNWISSENSTAIPFLIRSFLSIHLSSQLRKISASVKNSNNWMSFSDIIQQVHELICEKSESSQQFIHSVQENYTLALVDEFQDTDRAQYEIFDTIFAQSDKENSQLFMIGDPKQSIYAFRGADIDTYLEARNDAQIFSLQQNYRTVCELGNCINHFYSLCPKPFFIDEIPYNKITFQPTSSKTGNLISLENNSPKAWGNGNFILDAWELDSSANKENEQARRTAQQIETLLKSSASLTPNGTPRRISCSDIAVLTQTNNQIELIKAELSKRNIKSISRRGKDVFQSEEAKTIQTLLEAMISPREKFLFILLNSPFFRFSGELLLAESQAEKFIHLSQQLREWFQIWKEKGILQALSQFATDVHLSVNCSSQQDGERILVNFIQIQELLHEEETLSHLAPKRLASWLSQARHSQTSGNNQRQQRLESDQNAVELVTIHSSKGLEYPIVFLPFLSSEVKSIKKGERFYLVSTQNSQILTHSSDPNFEQFKPILEEKAQQESARLFYVGLTRASQLVVLSMLNVISKQGKESIAGSIFSLLFGEKNSREEIISFIGKNSFPNFVLLDNKNWELPISPELNPSFSESTSQNLQARTLTARTFHPKNFISSFTSLTHSPNEEKQFSDPESITDPDAPTLPEIESSLERESNPNPLLSALKGATFGTIIHEIFETITPELLANFEEKKLYALIASAWANHATPTMATTAITQTIQILKNQPETEIFQQILLAKSEREQTQLCLNSIYQVIWATLETPLPGINCPLKQIDWNLSKAEMEFFLPISQFNLPKVAEKLAKRQVREQDEFPISWQTYADSLSKLNTRKISGFLTGKIDMTFLHEEKFYVIDWKTNNLSRHISLGYPIKNAIAEEMQQAHYLLQYQIYLVALDQHFRQFWPNYSFETHFGGVIYPFVRFIPTHAEDAYFIDKPEFLLF